MPCETEQLSRRHAGSRTRIGNERLTHQFLPSGLLTGSQNLDDLFNRSLHRFVGPRRSTKIGAFADRRAASLSSLVTQPTEPFAELSQWPSGTWHWRLPGASPFWSTKAATGLIERMLARSSFFSSVILS